MTTSTLTDAQLTEIETSAPWLANTCHSLLRQQSDALDAFLQTVILNSSVDQTKASVHCHFLAHDGNGRPRTEALAKAVAERIIDYCIPRREFEAAKQYLVNTNSSKEIVKLERKAQSLFTDLAQSGEGGEMLLYLLVESVLKIPQLLCKMPLKTSSHVHYHGVDGVHGAVDEHTGMLALYWGESKLHANVNQAVRECFKSVAPFLLESGKSKAAHARDLYLLRDNLELNDPKLEEAIQKYLDPDDPKYNKLQFRAVCLVGFDSTAYPSVPDVGVEAKVKQDIEAVLDEWHQKVKRHVTRRKLDAFTLEVFCLPFPSVEKFRAAFREELGLA